MLCDVDGGAQQDRVAEGMDSVAQKLKEALEQAGAKVLLNLPVSRVLDDVKKTLVTVETRTGAQFTAKKLVVAVPPSVRFNSPFWMSSSRSGLICRPAADRPHRVLAALAAPVPHAN